ncbi:PAS domain S-box protein [Desulfopila sp. IMCC35008]|uniref:PAS domain S-box protein n=1 Tax=Desulfopila sp. IMCC35008 TaxID=2653858 RepID=UPI0013D0C38F|nr:PAS domain S-box protein [Desulfopila sp. IMCC35008]
MPEKPSYDALVQRVHELEMNTARHERVEAIARALFELSFQVNLAPDLDGLFAKIHEVLSTVVDTTNFYIALYDQEQDRIHFPYHVDMVDDTYPPVIGITKISSLTAEVIRSGNPLMITKEDIQKMWEDESLAAPLCTPSEIWLGVPLKTRKKLIGVMAVQSYENRDCYDQTDMEIMVSAGSQVALAIEHFVAVESLKQSENRYRGLIDLAVEGILLGSGEGVITEANKYVCEILGLRREEVVGRHISQLPFTPESVERFPLRFDLLQQGKKVVTERAIQRPDGSEVQVEMRSKMMPDGTYQSIFSDISERKRVEQELRESEERFRALHDASFGGIAIHDQGTILDCNQGLADMTGYSLDELIGFNGFELIAPEYLDTVIENIRNSNTQPYVAEGVRKDGTRYPLSIRGSVIPYRGQDARVTEFRDITEQRRAENEKKQLEEQLYQAQKMETIGQLAGGVAHDFNNMLGVIIGHSEMALGKLETDAPVVSDLKQIRKAADRSADITRQLLAFARKQAVSPKVLDLNRTIEGMLQMLRRLIGEHIELQWLPGEELWPVNMDTSQLDQILVNLCVNSRDAIEGMGTLSVKTSNCILEAGRYVGEPVLTTGEYVCIEVTDDGCGMDNSTLEHVFEPFFTTKGVGKGTGLGLATVYGAVKQNDGIVNVASEAEKGTTFEIYLPRHLGDDFQIAGGGNAGISLHGTETILLVEDEIAILEMTRKMLEQLGYEVIPAHSPFEALTVSNRENLQIDMVITDVIMPELNGRDLVRRLIEKSSLLKVLYMSGYTADIISRQGTLEEGMHFIQKPFSLGELGEKVRQVLDGSP